MNTFELLLEARLTYRLLYFYVLEVLFRAFLCCLVRGILLHYIYI